MSSYQFPSVRQNPQRQSNQFLTPTTIQMEADYRFVRPSINSASNESMANLDHMFKQQAPNQPSRQNNDPLSNELRRDRKLLSTMRANAHQNPFQVINELYVPTELTYTGGNIDMISDLPPPENELLKINDGLNSHTLPMFIGGDNQERSKVVPRTSSSYLSVNFPNEMGYERFNMTDQ